MIQQMFGRAGRAGKESEGWSMLVCASDEVGRWRQRLADGYTIRSGLLDGMADHLLGEVVQGRIKTLREMEQWWVSTLAYHQGTREVAPLNRAKTFLETWKFIECTEVADADQEIKATALGGITSKMMVPVQDAANIISRLTRMNTPSSHTVAESALIDIICTEVWSLANNPDAPQDQSPALGRILAAEGDVRALDRVNGGFTRNRVPGSEVVKAGLLLVARSPQAMASRGRQVAGVNTSLFGPALYDTPRYLAWVAALGPMGLAPAWASIVAADLGARVSHYRLAPPRGAGRLLKMCEQTLGVSGASKMSSLWEEIKSSGACSPTDWPFAGRPAGSSLDEKQYRTLLSGRVSLDARDGKVSAPPGVTVFTATGSPNWSRVAMRGGTGSAKGLVASFGQRGDWSGSGWLERFSRIMS